MVENVTVDKKSYSLNRRYDGWLGGGKFIVAYVSGRKVVWAPSASISEHKELLASLEGELGFGVSVNGGGWLYIHETTKQIFVWGQSVRYGEETDRSETVEMLEEFFTDYAVLEADPREVLVWD